MSLVQWARTNGRGPPSLLQPHDPIAVSNFDTSALKVLSEDGSTLSPGPNLIEDFKHLLQMAEQPSDIQTNSREMIKGILSQRRCLILAIVGATPSNNQSLEQILSNGYLSTVKLWLDDILKNSIGGVDLLLHLLQNIQDLPVTKSIVKQSGMGKSIGSISKNKMCANTANENSINDRIQQVMNAWKKSVKVLKDKDEPMKSPTLAMKRQLADSHDGSSPVSKKAKLGDTRKSSLTNLVKKVAQTKSNIPTKNTTEMKPKEPFRLSSVAKIAPKNLVDENKKFTPKKSLKRVKWADHFGGNLMVAKIFERQDAVVDDNNPNQPVSWSDRKKRDRLREKELLSQVKKAKLLDDDEDSRLTSPQGKTQAKTVFPTVAWHQPQILPIRLDVSPPQVDSKEVANQTRRMSTVLRVRYTSDRDVPNNPAPLTDVEQAIDMTSQSSARPVEIPFFVPQQNDPSPAPAPAVDSFLQPTNIAPPPPSSTFTLPTVSNQPQSDTESASAATVQNLGLPLFLVGQNVRALRTLANTPSLLSTFADSRGLYDEARLLGLVQTLSQNIAPALIGATNGYRQQPPAFLPPGQSSMYAGSTNGLGGIYGPASGSQYGSPASIVPSFGGSGGPARTGYRGDQNNGDGNLHLSGYGPATTQADIIQLFAPYVKVDEVVMKGTFCFVNTNDPDGAKHAREALSGAHLGGSPIRINAAQRKNRDPNYNQRASASSFGDGATGYKPAAIGAAVSMPGAPPLAIDANNVRDDRGNPATKNLFVAGYGPGTSEVQVREVFGQYAEIVGVVMKGTFSFVNTSDRLAAIQARESLSGQVLNGGVLRINFAKETGRLGTSFDLTYTGGGGPGATGAPSGGGHSHYGRAY